MKKRTINTISDNWDILSKQDAAKSREYHDVCVTKCRHISAHKSIPYLNTVNKPPKMHKSLAEIIDCPLFDKYIHKASVTCKMINRHGGKNSKHPTNYRI